MRRSLARLVIAVPIVLVIVLVGTGIGGYIYLRQSLPDYNATVAVPGISGPIEIVRDADAVPHITASTKLDALYGLGYVHAQDRLWQMEFQRRIGHGRLSEIFGEATVPQDRFLRTVGFGRAARSAWERLPADAKTQIDAYVAGVNAFIDTHRGRRLPPEFQLLRFEPEHFTGVDVIAWVKMMAWDLSANYSLELLRQDILGAVGPERMAQLMPPYPADGLSIVNPSRGTPPPAPSLPSELPRSSALKSRGAVTRALFDSLQRGNASVRSLLLDGATTEALGSNNWVVDGTMTASGKPLLANDPHLGAHVPSLWYLAHLSAGEFDVIGATLPGAPAVAIGRNKYIAWGETNVAADVEDLFLEHIDGAANTAEYRGVQEPIRTVPETVVVKGGFPLHLDVRVTRHGPLVSDAINVNNAELQSEPRPQPMPATAFKWTALDDTDTTVVAFLELNEARNWDEFTTALRDFVVPSQNFVYADVDGHIGYYAPGRIPVRSKGDGAAPAEGWTGDGEWLAWVPFEELPHAYDPPDHFIVTANNRPMPADYPHFIALEYPEPYRAQRIHDLLSHRQHLTTSDFRDIQADTLSLNAKALVPLLLRHVKTETSEDARAVSMLRAWDFNASGDSAAEAIFEAWFSHLTRAIVADELGPVVAPKYAERYSYITRFLQQTLGGPASPWCDDVNTKPIETCDQMVTESLQDALFDLGKRLGNNPANWRWSGVHSAVFPHQGLDSVSLLRPFLSRSMPNGGDWSTVDVGAVAADAPFEQHSVPGYRQIVDLSPANESLFLDAVGESGHFLSPHYSDFLQDWQRVRHRKMRMDKSSIEAGAIGHLRLTPAP